MIEKNKNEVAAIIIEPVAGNMGCILPKDIRIVIGYWSSVTCGHSDRETALAAIAAVVRCGTVDRGHTKREG